MLNVSVVWAAIKIGSLIRARIDAATDIIIEKPSADRTTYVTKVVPDFTPARPKTAVTATERILGAFRNMPITKGRVDFAYDPLAQFYSKRILPLRINGMVVATTVETYPSEGHALTEKIKSAHLNQGGYTSFSVSPKELGPVELKWENILSTRPGEKDLVLVFPETGMHLRVVTAPAQVRQTQWAGIAKLIVDTGMELSACAPVPGGAGGRVVTESVAKLPLAMRHAVVSGMLDAPNVSRAIGRHASGSRLGILGTEQMDRTVTRGFECPAEPGQPPVPVKAANFAGVVAALAAWVRRVRQGAQAQPQPTAPADAKPFILAERVAIENDVSLRLSIPRGVTVSFDVRRGSHTRVEGHVIKIWDARISRDHASVTYDATTGTLTVQDVSKNGTRVVVDNDSGTRVRQNEQAFDVGGAGTVRMVFGGVSMEVTLEGPVLMKTFRANTPDATGKVMRPPAPALSELPVMPRPKRPD